MAALGHGPALGRRPPACTGHGQRGLGRLHLRRSPVARLRGNRRHAALRQPADRQLLLGAPVTGLGGARIPLDAALGRGPRGASRRGGRLVGCRAARSGIALGGRCQRHGHRRRRADVGEGSAPCRTPAGDGCRRDASRCARRFLAVRRRVVLPGGPARGDRAGRGRGGRRPTEGRPRALPPGGGMATHGSVAAEAVP